MLDSASPSYPSQSSVLCWGCNSVCRAFYVLGRDSTTEYISSLAYLLIKILCRYNSRCSHTFLMVFPHSFSEKYSKYCRSDKEFYEPEYAGSSKNFLANLFFIMYLALSLGRPAVELIPTVFQSVLSITVNIWVPRMWHLLASWS